jgi:hypothetical protein
MWPTKIKFVVFKERERDCIKRSVGVEWGSAGVEVVV